MNGTLGDIGILLSTVSAVFSTVAGVIAWKKGSRSAALQARSFALLAGFGVVVATFAMERALLTHDFSLAYVAANNSLETPTLFTVTGMWSALQGSILLWALVEAINVAVLVFLTRRRSTEKAATIALLVAVAILGFFVVMMLGPANPFSHVVGAVPIDGKGPNPLLQNYPLVAVHPPLLYSGFVSLSIPYALWIGDRFSPHTTPYFRELARKWGVVSFSLLTLGITLGAWWSYQVLGWGGFWAWDPVENAALMPWVFTVVYLHSAYLAKRRPNYEVWSFVSMAGAFSFTILGTYFTRSGVLQSVHAFSASSLGTLLIGFFVVISVLSVYVALTRFDSGRVFRPVPPRPSLRRFSRSNLLGLNYIVFGVLVFIILLGTVFPLIGEAVNGQTVTVGAPYFNTFVAPLGALLIVLMAVAPVASWRGTSISELAPKLLVPGFVAALVSLLLALKGVQRPGLLAIFALASFSAAATLQTYMNRISSTRPLARAIALRSNGGLISHLGILMVATALASATSFGHKAELRLSPGQSADFFGQTITYLGPRTHTTPAQTSLEAEVLIDGVGPYYPAVSQFGTYTQPVGSPAVAAHLTKDIYLTLDQPPTKISSPVLIGVIIQPMIDWLWIGAAVVALGGFISLFGARPKPTRRYSGGADDETPSKPDDNEEVDLPSVGSVQRSDAR